MGSKHFVACSHTGWTTLYFAPSPGWFYLWSTSRVTVSWRRHSSGFPWYSEGRVTMTTPANLGGLMGYSATVFTGGPSLFCQIDVKPDVDASLMIT